VESQRKLNNILLNAVVDGCTGAALFGRLRWLGAPKQFIDTRPVAIYLGSEEASGDLKVARAHATRPAKVFTFDSKEFRREPVR
jgi:hypothetical protein